MLLALLLCCGALLRKLHLLLLVLLLLLLLLLLLHLQKSVRGLSDAQQMLNRCSTASLVLSILQHRVMGAV